MREKNTKIHSRWCTCQKCSETVAPIQDLALLISLKLANTRLSNLFVFASIPPVLETMGSICTTQCKKLAWIELQLTPPSRNIFDNAPQREYIFVIFLRIFSELALLAAVSLRITHHPNLFTKPLNKVF
jgi:hypothetical protein